MATRMPRRLAALSASAVATIYLAGLLSTRPAANDIVVDAASTPQISPESTLMLSTPEATNTAVVVGASAPATASPQPSAVLATSTPVVLPTRTPARAAPTPAPTATTQPAPAASTYTSGTYTGTGTSRLGDVTVSVTISADRIINVQITRSTTKYPVSRIASLPAQVISTQSANVNVVTGATASSQAFKQAVQQALAQARAAA